LSIIGDAFSGFGAAVEAAFGLSRAARVRRSIDANLNTYKSMQEIEPLADASRNLAAAITSEVSRLCAVVEGRSKKQRDLGAAIVGLTCTGVISLPMLWTSNHLDHWWGWALLILNGLVTLLFFSAAVAAGLTPPRKSKTQSAAAQDARSTGTADEASL